MRARVLLLLLVVSLVKYIPYITGISTIYIDSLHLTAHAQNAEEQAAPETPSPIACKTPIYSVK